MEVVISYINYNCVSIMSGFIEGVRGGEGVKYLDQDASANNIGGSRWTPVTCKQPFNKNCSADHRAAFHGHLFSDLGGLRLEGKR